MNHPFLSASAGAWRARVTLRYRPSIRWVCEHLPRSLLHFNVLLFPLLISLPAGLSHSHPHIRVSVSSVLILLRIPLTLHACCRCQQALPARAPTYTSPRRSSASLTSPVVCTYQPRPSALCFPGVDDEEAPRHPLSFPSYEMKPFLLLLSQ